MAGDLTFTEQVRSLAAQRAAETLLRTLGATVVAVRVARLAPPAGDAGQIGGAGAATEDVELADVVWRPLAGEHQRAELLLAPATLIAARELTTAEAAREFFLEALGVIAEGRLWRVTRFQAEVFGGAPYLYRVVVAA